MEKDYLEKSIRSIIAYDASQLPKRQLTGIVRRAVVHGLFFGIPLTMRDDWEKQGTSLPTRTWRI